MRIGWLVSGMVVSVLVACGGGSPTDPSDSSEAGSGGGGAGGVGGGGSGGEGGTAGTPGCTLPAIASLDPDRAPSGYSPVFFRGECLGGERVEVHFAGATSVALEIAADGSFVRTSVPVGAATGEVFLLVDGVRVNGPVFTVTNDHPVPHATSVTPAVIPVGSSTTTVTLNGTGVVADSVLYLDDVPVTPSGRTATSLRVAVDAALLADQGRHVLRFENPSPGGGVSEDVEFVVNGPYDLVAAVPVGSNLLRLEFDVAPDESAAEVAANYTIAVLGSPTYEKLPVTRAVVDASDRRRVLLTTGPQEPGAAYRVICYGIPNEFGGSLSIKGMDFEGYAP